jgi:hypothetical protein
VRGARRSWASGHFGFHIKSPLNRLAAFTDALIFDALIFLVCRSRRRASSILSAKSGVRGNPAPDSKADFLYSIFE